MSKVQQKGRRARHNRSERAVMTRYIMKDFVGDTEVRCSGLIAEQTLRAGQAGEETEVIENQNRSQ